MCSGTKFQPPTYLLLDTRRVRVRVRVRVCGSKVDGKNQGFGGPLSSVVNGDGVGPENSDLSKMSPRRTSGSLPGRSCRVFPPENASCEVISGGCVGCFCQTEVPKVTTYRVGKSDILSFLLTGSLTSLRCFSFASAFNTLMFRFCFVLTPAPIPHAQSLALIYGYS